MSQLFDLGELVRQDCDSKFHACSFSFMGKRSSWSVAGLFAGIGGIELGLQRVGMCTELLCESWQPAREVLEHRFADVPIVPDVRDLPELPAVDLVTAGFPCTDLSQAGRTRGITGEASGLVGEVFRLLRGRRVPWVVLENVRNMLVLEGGTAMRFLVDELEQLGYQWAYRLVDSRFTGVPQRRQRVIFVATTEGDPREVLFADDEGERDPGALADDSYGFYWTEGLRGLGWAQDAVPTLKGGSTIGIPSPPAIWNPGGEPGHRLVVPNLVETEQLQGFEAGWTAPAEWVSRGKGARWKLVGNAVTVGVSEWVAERLLHPAPVAAPFRPLSDSDAWPKSACGALGKRWAVDVSLFPRNKPYIHLADLVDLEASQPLSQRAAAGFLERATRSSLRFVEGFLDEVVSHIDAQAAA